MKKFIAVAMASILLSGCSDATSATNALDNLGMKDIQTNGYPIFNDCGEKYSHATKFTARNPNGKIVSGVVCSTFFGTSTVKFY